MANDYEKIERTAFNIVVQALREYSSEAITIFGEEVDKPQDIAEDITREAMDSLGVSGSKERLYGKVDYKKAIYVFLPDPYPVALMVDTKAERPNGDRTATIQMSQTSMRVKMNRAGREFDELGKLEKNIIRGDQSFFVVTIVAKYIYSETAGKLKLEKIITACIPNGHLQKIYNPTADDTIWRAGRDAPTLDEDFRVRLDFNKLKKKAAWRVVEIRI